MILVTSSLFLSLIYLFIYLINPFISLSVYLTTSLSIFILSIFHLWLQGNGRREVHTSAALTWMFPAGCVYSSGGQPTTCISCCCEACLLLTAPGCVWDSNAAFDILLCYYGLSCFPSFFNPLCFVYRFGARFTWFCVGFERFFWYS